MEKESVQYRLEKCETILLSIQKGLEDDTIKRYNKIQNKQYREKH